MSKKVFISYSHVDQALIDRLHKHLAHLQRDGTISEWYDREIHAGGNIGNEVMAALDSADIFIACASPDYIASNYCYERELNRALEREKTPIGMA
ncbi:toll/interleukin-1 receptor domain-containing protein [Sphingomonas lutea]|uniref:Toll/interleukin-1 receptor domain-containing protein n=1 Tax=Sphingomonas lutea TaxID=1045317 RepID=A0A7G9SHS9_9SPHN|nr:toll/interleukin-1 receptor domain-containing protein [Sphingomonas lutea]QNN67404.1 toll/interleukin-1 receptor domain-containing protein [Sphingomonas lutea]